MTHEAAQPRPTTSTAEPRSDAPLDWATEPMMSPADALMWRGDADRRLRGTICMLEVLDQEPDWERFIAAHEWGSRMAPRFRQRVVDSAFGAGTPTWSVDPDFDLHYHLRRMRVAGDGSWAEALRIAAQVAMTPLDPQRPPWEAVLLEGLADGQAAYLLKVHHALTDGLGAIEGLAQLHSQRREPWTDKPQPPEPHPDEVSSATILARQLGRDLRRVPGLLDAASKSARAAVRPRATLRSSLRFARSAAKVAGVTAPPGSPLLQHRSSSWRFSTLDIDFADLRAAAKAAGGSVNDAYLAGLIGGFRIYHEKMGQPVDTIPVAIPISVRDPGEPRGGNRIAVGRLAAPVSIGDAFERLLTIREQVRAARREPAVDLFNAVSPVLAWLPAPALLWMGGATSINDLQASNVAGIPFDVYLAGAKVERMYPFGPLPGCAVMATMITHGPVACLGINQDVASVTDVDLFADCLVDGFAEVLALGPGGAPVRRV